MQGASPKDAPPKSEAFDDVYFSAEDGLAETQHVFIAGNNLPEAWKGRDHFVIAETGFGTGLNFLSTWKLFRSTAKPGQKLHFISVEKHPLDREEIRLYLRRWAHNFEEELDALVQRYPMLVPGFHRLFLDDDTAMTLIFDDVNDVMPQLNAHVDAWYLDGFKPSTNPEMWTDTVFSNMARLSVPDASFATFTAAGDVRRGLEKAGFAVKKAKGFGRKRDMLVGKYSCA